MSPSLLVLKSTHVDRITSSLSSSYLQSLMADVFALVSSSSVTPTSYIPQRIVFPTENHKALFMPSRICEMGTTMKVVSVPTNPGDLRGLPASTIVLDKNTGGVKAIVNARTLTALRNAAGSLLSTSLIGPSRPTHIVAFGAGQQILAHLDLHLKAFPSIQSCIIINRSMNQRFKDTISSLRSKHPDSSTVRTLQCLEWDATALASEEGASGAAADAVRRALSTASIVITATSSRMPLFPSSWVPSGAHVILIGSYTPEMKEVDKDLIMRAVSKDRADSKPRLLVDSIHACSQEAGELIDAGLEENQMVEIGKVVLERRQSGSTLEEQKRTEIRVESASNPDFSGPITMFKSVGVGLQDVAIACAVVDRAEELRSAGEDNLGILVDGYDTV
ncbi:NAD(P)-binding protein [Dendrothele bispora CBS 962.96]|uniref:NAD(P)-binding protein n=1 Tax=Dendrothele bispora (strain CBS 962.96) TaxID=1314807 RepID=A0A4S8MIL6_DENBC|nr:NAD(P)-binding protein [Dendrothele bispora CBS 962.96]